MPRLIDAYDCAMFDLDGVLYLGPAAVPGAAEAVTQLRRDGVRLGYVTNNAARTPATVAAHLRDLGIPAEVDDVVTSSQAGARMLATELPPGAKVLIVGTQALADEVALVGLTPVWSSADQPTAVIQGYDPGMTWPRLDDACYAIQAGARWYATNTDANRPTDRGRVPGAGAQIGVVATSVQGTPRVAGKPCRPLMDETIVRLDATRPIFVGDRIDTDIVGAFNVGMDSLFVFTGTHGKRDLLEATPQGRPTHIGYGLEALLQPARQLDQVTPAAASCRGQRAVRQGRTLSLETSPATRDEQLDALWALLHLAWRDGGDFEEASAQLDLLP